MGYNYILGNYCTEYQLYGWNVKIKSQNKSLKKTNKNVSKIPAFVNP